jgi:hypothetical protein
MFSKVGKDQMESKFGIRPFDKSCIADAGRTLLLHACAILKRVVVVVTALAGFENVFKCGLHPGVSLAARRFMPWMVYSNARPAGNPPGN